MKRITKQNIKISFFLKVMNEEKKALLPFHMIGLPSVGCTPKATNVGRRTELIKKKKEEKTKQNKPLPPAIQVLLETEIKGRD